LAPVALSSSARLVLLLMSSSMLTVTASPMWRAICVSKNSLAVAGLKMPPSPGEASMGLSWG